MEGLGVENVGIFHDHLENFTSTWRILWPFDTVCCHLVYFPLFWYVWTKKNLATLVNRDFFAATAAQNDFVANQNVLTCRAWEKLEKVRSKAWINRPICAQKMEKGFTNNFSRIGKHHPK
jgi:hypothetical protein